MRRFLTLFTMFMLCGVLAFAQNRVVSGKVADENGNPVPFASVKVKGSRSGVSADAYGQYTIRVKDNEVLEISGTGFKTKEVNVGSQTFINTAMERGANSLTEVVISSNFNTKRTARSTSSNAQVVSSEQLNTIRTQNVNNALAGKVAGVQVRSQAVGKLGVETAVRLRGENGLGAGAGALYVVDGTIMPSSNDINTDDVEDITILQGPAGAALFGPDGANGVIVITTKKARKGQKGIGVEINSGTRFDKVYITPQYQNSYAGGGVTDFTQYTWKSSDPIEWKALDGKFYHDYSDDASWGPRIAGQEYIPWYAWYPGSQYSYKTAKLTPQPNNIRDFYNTGVTLTNNINLSKAGDGYSFRISYTNLDQKGLVPNEYLKRHTFNANFNVDLSNHFSIAANINYIAQNRNAENDDGYSNQGSGSFSSWYHRDLDMGIMKELRGLKSPTGILASWNHNNPSAYDVTAPVNFYGGNYWANFYSYFDNISNKDRRDRLFGNITGTYKINNDLKVALTYRKQQLTTNNESIQNSLLESSLTQSSFNYYENNGKASYGTSSSFSDRQNFEGVASYSKKIKDFAINANVGFDILKTRLRDVSASTNGGLVVPNLYALSNSKTNISSGNNRQQTQRRTLFGRADFGFRNYLFVEGSYRRDYLSTQPEGDFIDTRSFGGSFVFSDLIKDKVPFLTFGKLRASWGEITQQLTFNQLNFAYTLNPQPLNGGSLMTTPDRDVAPGLTGAVNVETEFGLDLRFLKNRVGLSGTYYTRVNKDFPVNVAVSTASGFTAISKNAGRIEKEGIELTLNLKPFVKKNFSWDFNATYGKILKNQIVEIAPGLTRLVVSSGAFSGSSSPYTVNEVGQPWGMMFGGGIKRLNGQPVLNSNGTFIKEADTKFGSVLPDYTGGFQNTFTIMKNFTVNVNIDYSWGGKFFSLSDFWGTFSGLTARTATLNDRGIPVRDDVANGGGVHVTGVDNTGKPVDYYVEAQTYYHQFRGANIGEASIYDLSFVKMRELSIGYRIPVAKLGIGKYVNSATFSVISSNPWLIYSKVKDFDPSEISSVYGEDGQFPGTRAIGVNLKIGF
jgi:TonB-linked SusC/RagA family outer membrane protein